MTAKSTNFTEVLTLNLSDFLEAAERFNKQLQIYEDIKRVLNSPIQGLTKSELAKRVFPGDLSLLGVVCQVCSVPGHVAMDCSRFGEIRGNLRQHWLKKMKDI
jgi:hypothetical protein